MGVYAASDGWRRKAVRLGHAPRSSFSAARGRFPVAVLLSAVRRKGSVPIVVPCGTGRAHGPGGDAVFRTERKGPAPSRNGKPFPGETLRRPFSAAGRRRSAAPFVRRDRPVPVPRAFRAVRAVPGGRAEGLVPDAFPQQGDFLLPPKRRPGNAVTSSQPFKKRRFSGPRGSRAPRTAVRTQRAVSPGPRERRVPFPSPFGNLPGRRPEAHRRPHAGNLRSSGPARATSARPPGNLPGRRPGGLRGRRGGGGFRRLRRRAGAFFGSPRRYLVFNSTRPLSRSISASLRLARRMYWRTGRRAMQT